MKQLAELAQLNLDPVARAQVEGMIQSLLEQVEQDAKLLQIKDNELQQKDFKIQALTLELAHIRRLRYGVKSESLGVLQRDLFEETLNTDLAAIETELEQLTNNQTNETANKPKRPRAGRQPLPEHLPRIDHYHEPESCQCGACGKGLVKIGENISEQLDVEPAKFFVHRHIRPQYACRGCETITAKEYRKGSSASG